MKEWHQYQRYRFRPPMVRPWLQPVVRWMNDRVYLRDRYQIKRTRHEGLGRVEALVRAGHSVLLAPNHADHADPHLLMHLAGNAGLELRFMAAREIFEVNWLAGLCLQHAGVFSVDRDGPDIAAIKTAIEILEGGDRVLVVFPEGEIYHHHEILDPLHDGVASIMLRAVRRMPEGREGYIVPVVLRYSHEPAVEKTFRWRLSRLERRIGWRPREDMPVMDRILRLGNGALAVKETEYVGEASSGEMSGRLWQLRENLLGTVEARLGCKGSDKTVPDRVRALRYRIRRRWLDEESPPDDAERLRLREDMDRVFTALQAYSYLGDYLTSQPGTDRMAETIMKLEEDLLGEAVYPTRRSAHVVFDDPIPVSGLVRDGVLAGRDASELLTRMLEDRISRRLAGADGQN